jgi:hypothetical protein
MTNRSALAKHEGLRDEADLEPEKLIEGNRIS